jgi:hypothetical protein
MQLGRTIAGAIIGGAIGIGVMVALYLSPLNLESVFLALLVAVLTGLGVRMMVATRGHASYLRGAVTCALALGAYLLGWNAVAHFAQQNAAKAAEASRVAPAADAGDDAANEAGDADPTKADDAEPVESAKAAATQPRAGVGRKGSMQTGSSVLDIAALCLSALVAYELGRGSAPKAMTVAETPPPEVPQGVHPDA